MKELMKLLMFGAFFTLHTLPSMSTQLEEEREAVRFGRILIAMAVDHPNLFNQRGAPLEDFKEVCLRCTRTTEASWKLREIRAVGERFVSPEKSSSLMRYLATTMRYDQVDRSDPKDAQYRTINFSLLLLEGFGIPEDNRDRARSIAYTYLTNILGTEFESTYNKKTGTGSGTPQVTALHILLRYFPESVDSHISAVFCAYWHTLGRNLALHDPRLGSDPALHPRMQGLAKYAPEGLRFRLEQDIFSKTEQQEQLRAALVKLFGADEQNKDASTSGTVSASTTESGDAATSASSPA